MAYVRRSRDARPRPPLEPHRRRRAQDVRRAGVPDPRQQCCGVNGDELIVRVDPERTEEALADPHACPMDFTGRPLRGFVTVSPAGLEGDGLERWVHAGAARAESLPPK